MAKVDIEVIREFFCNNHCVMCATSGFQYFRLKQAFKAGIGHRPVTRALPSLWLRSMLWNSSSTAGYWVLCFLRLGKASLRESGFGHHSQQAQHQRFVVVSRKCLQQIMYLETVLGVLAVYMFLQLCG